jgi:hypothetical protein
MKYILKVFQFWGRNDDIKREDMDYMIYQALYKEWQSPRLKDYEYTWFKLFRNVFNEHTKKS